MSRSTFIVGSLRMLSVGVIGAMTIASVSAADAVVPEHPARVKPTPHFFRRLVVPVQITPSTYRSRRDVWQRKGVKPFNRPTSGSTVPLPTVEPATTSGTGAKLKYDDLNDLQRQELRDLLRRGGCPEHLDSGVRELCLQLLKRAPKPAERPQQFHRGDLP